ncbi:unnamed protein product [Fraxinus pennsylvanica]|uniref:Uncharacterized protein n=1 Tax=Fraxinus pennsylvanica TaxID=56036 RepID=A0AAD2E5L8_9LAMI|nr:unnamed protein product [Fraxinus pennsylvanica]
MGVEGMTEKGKELVETPQQAQHSMLPPFSNSQIIFGDEESQALTQQVLPAANSLQASTSNVLVNYPSNVMPCYYPNFSYNVGTQLGIVEGTLRSSATGVFPLGFHGSFQPLPPPSAIASWMSTATHSIPPGAGVPSSLFDNQSSGMAYQDAASGIGMAFENVGSSRRPPF